MSDIKLDNENYYNTERKEWFLREKEKEGMQKGYITKYLYTFSTVCPYEYQFDKDVCEWTYYEIVEYYKMQNSSSLNALSSQNAALSKYTQFCQENDLIPDGQNHFAEVTISVLEECLNKALVKKKILTREEVLDIVSKIDHPRDKFLVLGMFELGNSNGYDVVANAMTYNVVDDVLIYKGNEYILSKELVEIISECTNEEEALISRGIRGDEKAVRLQASDRIFKQYNNFRGDDRRAGRNAYIRFADIMDVLGFGYIKSNNFVNSGKIHMIKERAKFYGISAKEYFYSDRIKEVLNQYNVNSISANFYKSYKDILET